MRICWYLLMILIIISSNIHLFPLGFNMHKKKLWKPKKRGRLFQNRFERLFLILFLIQLSPIMNIPHFNKKVGKHI